MKCRLYAQNMIFLRHAVSSRAAGWKTVDKLLIYQLTNYLLLNE